MTFAIVYFSVLVILSNFVLENVEGQSARGGDSYTVFQALQTLTTAVESLQAKIESQTTKLSNFEAKVEMQVNNLETKVDAQASSLSTLDAESKIHTNLLNNLKVTTQGTTAAMEANLLNIFEEKFSVLENLVNNVMAEDQKQVTSLKNVDAKVETQAALLTNLNATINIQATSLINLEAGSNTQKSLLNSLQNATVRHSNLLKTLETKADLQATLLTNSQAQSIAQATSLNNSVNNLNGNIEMQATSLSALKAESKVQKNSLYNLESTAAGQTNLLNNLEANADMQTTLLTNFQAQLQFQATLLSNLVAEVEWHEPVAHFKNNRTIVAFLGEDVEMWCVVRGTPSPEMKWTIENGTLSERVMVENNGKTLRIKNVQVSDEGTYICVAANGVGTPASQSVRLEVFGPAEQCHKMIESDTGHLEEGPSSTSCLWVIKLQNTTGFSLELDPQMKEPVLFIPQQNPSNSIVLPIRVIGSKNSSHKFGGKSLAIVLPPRKERMALSWTGLDVDDSGVSSSTKFLKDLGGTLEWESELDGTDKIFWLFDLELNGELNWTLSTSFAGRDLENPCRDVSLSVFQIRPDGNVNEIERTCDDSTGGSLKLEIRSQVLVVLHVESTEASKSKLSISWPLPDEPLKKNVDGIVAGTNHGGFFVIPFNSAQTKAVPSGSILGLTFDWNSRRIYYLKNGVGILRSNLDGSASETLVSDLSSSLWGLTIEPTTGNVYYGNQTSRTIRVCNNDATKCSTISNSSDLSSVHDVAVHRTKGLLFWSINNKKVVRANLDGSNATVLLQRNVRGLNVDEHEDRLYWGLHPEGIESCDLNGQDIRTLPNVKGFIYDVAIDNDRVYYADYNTNKIHGISKSGTDSTLVTPLPNTIYHIALFGTQVSDQPWNPCKKSECAHLCVLVTRWSYRCTCPDNQVLNADGKTCTL